MKINLIILFLLVFSVDTIAQSAETEAQLYYTQAEVAYTEGRFDEVTKTLEKCENALGKINSKILYLRIKALDTLFKESIESSKLDLIRIDIKTFFSITDESKYPKEKYYEIFNLKNFYSESSDNIENFVANFYQKNIDLIAANLEKKPETALRLYENYFSILVTQSPSKYKGITNDLVSYNLTLMQFEIQNDNQTKFNVYTDFLKKLLKDLGEGGKEIFEDEKIGESICTIYEQYYFKDVQQTSQKNKSTYDKSFYFSQLLSLKETITANNLSEVSFTIKEPSKFTKWSSRKEHNKKPIFDNLKGSNRGTTTLNQYLFFREFVL